MPLLPIVIIYIQTLFGFNNKLQEPIITYTINNKQVAKKEFYSLLNSLKEIPHTWYCAETLQGGRTGYKVKDKKGVIYSFESKSIGDSTSCTLQKAVF